MQQNTEDKGGLRLLLHGQSSFLLAVSAAVSTDRIAGPRAKGPIDRRVRLTIGSGFGGGRVGIRSGICPGR